MKVNNKYFLGFLGKGKKTSIIDNTFANDNYQELSRSKSSDYMNYFFKERNNKELSKPILNHLESLSYEELKKLAIDILSVTFGFLRYSAEFRGSHTEQLDNVNFYNAIIWHLSDATHNIPTHINEPPIKGMGLTSYMTEFFVFVEVYERLKDRPRFLRLPESNLFSFREELRKLNR